GADVPSGDEHRRRLVAGRNELAPRPLVHEVGRPDQAADLRGDEGPGTERGSSHGGGGHRAHEGGSARPVGLDSRRRPHDSTDLPRRVRESVGSLGQDRHAMPRGWMSTTSRETWSGTITLTALL